MTHDSLHILPDHAAVYTIKIQGQIGEHWLSHFESFEIEMTGEGRSAITTIRGRLVDQAALHGVLQHLYGLGLVLLRVERK